MPGFDGTGPSGRGPMTGGARGLCNPSTPASQGRGTYWPRGSARTAASPAGGRGRPRWGLARGAGGRGRRGRGHW